MRAHVRQELRDLLLAVPAGGRPEHQERRPAVGGSARESHVLPARDFGQRELRRAAAEQLAGGVIGRHAGDRRERRPLGHGADQFLGGNLGGRVGHDLLKTLDLRDHQSALGVDQGQVRDVRHLELLGDGETVVHQQCQVRRHFEHQERLPQHLGPLVLPASRDREHLVLRRLSFDVLRQGHEGRLGHGISGRPEQKRDRPSPADV